ncbi:5'-3' exonuclease [Ammoniphilus resinae]|nr:5'-3' exonuclease H3TH domain-containing protein [Ammoniphilus resinae]
MESQRTYLEEGACKVLLSKSKGIYPLAISIKSLINQLKKKSESFGVETVELTDKGWIKVKLLDQSLSQVEKHSVSHNKRSIQFTMEHGLGISEAICTFKEVESLLMQIKKRQQEATVESVQVEQGTFTIRVKEEAPLRTLPTVTQDQEERFLILDGSNILNRAFYATAYHGTENLMKTSEGLYTNAVYGFVEMLSRFLKQYRPTHLAIAWDVSRDTTFRRSIFPEYKNTRSETDPVLKEQFSTMKELLELMNVSQIQVEGYEADDIIGTLSRKWSKEKKGKCLLASNDRDLLQLLDEQTVQLIKGKSGEREYSLMDFQKDFGILPSQWPCVKGLLGDEGDNLPGCKGVGKVAAAPLIRQFGSLERVFENLEHLGSTNFKRYVKKLQEGKEDALLTKELAIIVDVLDLENIELDDFRVSINEKGMRQGFEKLEFQSLLEKRSLIA